MTSTSCNDEWLVDVAAREHRIGFVEGGMLGIFIAMITVAIVATYAFSERKEAP